MRERLIKAKVRLEVPLQESVGYIEPGIARSMKAASQPVIDSINKQLGDLEKKLRALVRTDEKVKQQHGFITSVPGVGNVTASKGNLRICHPQDLIPIPTNVRKRGVC